MISRRTLLAAGAASLAAPHVLRAAQGPYTIFMITYRGETDVERGFRDYLDQRGIATNIISRSADLDPTRVPGILEEVRKVRPDLVYTWGTPVTLATFGRYDDPDDGSHINDIPGVFTMVSTPEKAGVVETRASSGRNITGTSHVVPPEPQLRAMEAYQPFTRLGVLYTPTEQNSVAIVSELKSLEPAMNFELVEATFPLDAEGKPHAETAPELVAGLAEAGAEWLYYLPDTFLSQNIQHVAPAATELRLPGFSAVELLQRDALISLVSRYYSLGQLNGYKAEQILVGNVQPQDIAIETLQRFALIINMPLAKKLELYPPLGMLSYANVLTD